MTPLDALLEILRSEGVDRIFGNPGTTELPFVDALVDVPDLPYVLALQEASAVSMADGYARATGRPSVVSLHVGAGVANGLIGMLNASRSRTPIVVIAGQQDSRHLMADPMLSADLVRLAGAAVKSAVEVNHPYDLPVLLRRAFAASARPPPGPVLVSIPMDLLEDCTQVEVPARSTTHPAAAAGGVEEAARVLAASAAPAIVAGDGVGREGAVQALVGVAERLGAAVYHQPMNDGVNFPGTHPLYVEMLQPRYAAIRERLAGHDTVLVVGCHAFMAHHYTPGPAIPDGVTVVQIDSDPAEIGRNFPVSAGLVGALPATLEALAAALDGRVPAAAGRLERALQRREDAARDRAAALPGEIDLRDGQDFSPLDPMAAAQAVASGLPPDAVVVEEAITVGLLLREVLLPELPGSYVHTVGGGLGWGIGAAIGTRMGRPDRPVVAVLGDGSAMFGLQGLWSAARYEVPVMFLVMNNGEYRTLKETLDRNGSRSTAFGRYVGMDLTPPALDWVAAGHLFGVSARRVSSAGELVDLVAGVGELDAPLLVDVPVLAHRDSLQPADTRAVGQDTARRH
jgi:benzoylformate decarboxylase